jgi:choline dehydrogenase-like flavoprotein
MDFDAIVVGSGITGGWAAKELTQAGLKVLMIERGREIRHQQDYDTETKAPWEMPFRGQGDTALYEREYRCRCSTAISPSLPRAISSTTRRTPTRPRTY